MIKSIFETNYDETDETQQQINSGSYSFFSLKGFFGFDDYICLVKIIYILISFILNLIMFISLKKRRMKNIINPISLQLISNILLINFIHSLSYMINWVTNLDHSIILNFNEEKYKIGGLLIGSPNEYFSICEIQGFMIVFSSLSQDIAINIFFFIINKDNMPSKIKIISWGFALGYIFPFLFTVIYALCGGLGLNDRYCYIKKFYFDNNINNYINNDVNYRFNEWFPFLLIILYSFRGINLLISIYLLINIIKYIRKTQLSTIYILKSSSILLIQIITFSIGFIYRISRIISNSNNTIISDIHLCINTIDGILFPLSFSLSNGIYTNLCYRDNNESLNSISEENNELLNISDISCSKSSSKNDFFKDDNNFDLSYM
jgi:hypothetical protein